MAQATSRATKVGYISATLTQFLTHALEDTAGFEVGREVDL